MNLIKQVLTRNNNHEKEYYILLSGQDYPLEKSQDIYDFFSKNYPTNFINPRLLPSKVWGSIGGINRIKAYHFGFIKEKRDSSPCIDIYSLWDRECYTLNNLLNICSLLTTRHDLRFLNKIFSKRKSPKNIVHHGGPQWWALTIESIKLIDKFLKRNPTYLTFHNFTLMPDEIFFHSIIGTFIKRETIAHHTLTYANWNNEKNMGSPEIIRLKDFEVLKTIKKKPRIYARKFDATIDSDILDKIDREFLNYS